MGAAILILPFLLFLIAAFGVGFILNMLVKKFPWTSTVVMVVIAAYFLIRMDGVASKIVYSLPWALGGIIASLTIRTLQRRGFKMFG
ncbi:MAG TPA: hypothetical protein VFV52_04460 [Bacilli bacterium]|nr:hypothetical protein [Bacilli bacterium]